MKNLSLLLIVICWYACSSTEEQSTLEQCNVIASKVITEEDTLIVCDVNKIEQHIKLPLSSLVENWKLLKLENSSKEVMVRPASIYPSKNYILIHPVEYNRGTMLFDKSGKYLHDIGKKGNGPGEIVNTVSDVYMDEENDCVYIRDLKPSRILKYRLSNGEYVQDIPLGYNKLAQFIVDADNNSLTATCIPHRRYDEGIPLIWQQDLEGNVLQGIPSEGYDKEGWSEFWLWKRNGSLTFYHFNVPARKDTLLHYIPTENRFIPRFTVTFGDEIPVHKFEDTSQHYLVTLLEGGLEFGSAIQLKKRFIVDKKTLKGAWVDIVLDGYGNFSISGEWMYLTDDYFTMSLYPHQVAETCEKLLAHPENLKPGEKKNLQELLDGLTEDDNAIIIYGKIK